MLEIRGKVSSLEEGPLTKVGDIPGLTDHIWARMTQIYMDQHGELLIDEGISTNRSISICVTLSSWTYAGELAGSDRVPEGDWVTIGDRAMETTAVCLPTATFKDTGR
ncbi:hypothetical protein BGZ63DRAFT_419075 [Mariannaea sp. PMI_226]|nr:hypothetical protein BGZ63DRAFT_419075 [Mariannaea sp. PMI_226]